MTSRCTNGATWSRTSFSGSKSSAASPPDMTKPTPASQPQSISLLPCSHSDECLQTLVRQRRVDPIEGGNAGAPVCSGPLLDQELGHRQEVHQFVVAQAFGFLDHFAHAVPDAKQRRSLLLLGEKPAATP